jgi:hypothetical protein
MKKTIITIIAILFAVNAFAQPAGQKPTLPTQTTAVSAAQSAPVTQPPAISVTSIRPAYVVSSEIEEVTKEITIRGTGLKDLTDTDIIVQQSVGGGGFINPAITEVDSSSDTTLKFKVTLGANAKGPYVVKLKGADVDQALMVKDPVTDTADRALVTANAAQAANKKLMNELAAANQRLTVQRQELDALKSRPTLDRVQTEIEGKVNTAVQNLRANELKGLAGEIGTLKSETSTLRTNVTVLQSAQAEDDADIKALAENAPKQGGLNLFGYHFGAKRPKAVVAVAQKRQAIIAARLATATSATGK